MAGEGGRKMKEMELATQLSSLRDASGLAAMRPVLITAMSVEFARCLKTPSQKAAEEQAAREQAEARRQSEERAAAAAAAASAERASSDVLNKVQNCDKPPDWGFLDWNPLSAAEQLAVCRFGAKSTREARALVESGKVRVP
jgi:hypothetical protein